MGKDKTGVSRREFAKRVGVGVGVAALSVMSLPALSSAAQPERIAVPRESIEVALKAMYPIIDPLCEIEYTKKKVTVHKKSKLSGEIERSIELNGIGGAVVQLCRGMGRSDHIAELVADIYTLDKKATEISVQNFLAYLFDEGYLTFASTGYIADYDKDRYGGLRVFGLKSGEANIIVRDKGGKRVVQTF